MDTQLIYELESLPAILQQEAKDFIGYLKTKSANQNASDFIKKPIPQLGIFKGRIKMADDFDAPLDDFKEYMQ